MSRKILVLGALSEIAEATARLYAAEGAAFLLVARDAARLDTVAADLRVRGAARVETHAADLATADPAPLMAEWFAASSGFDLVLLAYGMLGDQQRGETDLAFAAEVIDTNFRSAALWSLAAANHLEAAGQGTLAVIGSVAGDRGRRSNYLYGATKGGLGILVAGLAHRLAASGARAVLIKPGFVDTAMTAHIPGKGALWTSPARAAAGIRSAIERKGAIAYVPGYWRWILLAIRAIPAPLFHRTKL